MKRILFVDDETKILEGLKRMLHTKRRVWSMTFVNSGQQALDLMQQQPFDVLVTDMRMPEMNGAELLHEVQKRFPRTVRIILSGHSDLEASMRSVSVSHQFLTKPCEAKTLKEVIQRALALDDLLQSTVLRETLGGVGELPVLPRVYHALTSALAEPEVDIQRVASIVERDSAVAAKVLQLVNSSFFGLGREICDIREATTYLGTNNLRHLVLSFEVFRQFDDNADRLALDLEQEQDHSLLAARIARRIAPDERTSDQAFLATMLHDLGKLLLATSYSDELNHIIKQATEEGRSEHEVELERFGVSHAEIGAYLLGLWGMPYPIVEAVAHHHDPTRVPIQEDFGVMAITYTANALVHHGSRVLEDSSVLNHQYLKTLGVFDSLPSWCDMAIEEAEQFASET